MGFRVDVVIDRKEALNHRYELFANTGRIRTIDSIEDLTGTISSPSAEETMAGSTSFSGHLGNN